LSVPLGSAPNEAEKQVCPFRSPPSQRSFPSTMPLPQPGAPVAVRWRT
jgi:hypothetical protein